MLQAKNCKDHLEEDWLAQRRSSNAIEKNVDFIIIVAEL